MRLLLAMMMHETNTFSPVVTDLARFSSVGGKSPDSGAAAIEAYRRTGTVAGAYIDVAEREGAEFELAVAADAQLPGSDLSDNPYLNLLSIRESGRVVGVVGVEVYGNVGMLRSLAVEPGSRKSGLGVSLVSGAEALAAARGVETLFLLTTTAARFFARLDYEAIARSEAPAAISATAQFSDLCPASSTFMRKILGANPSQQARRP